MLIRSLDRSILWLDDASVNERQASSRRHVWATESAGHFIQNFIHCFTQIFPNCDPLLSADGSSWPDGR
jgi:hypothetical protein